MRREDIRRECSDHQLAFHASRIDTYDYLYLFKSQTHQAVKKLCDDQDESFSISESALGKALLAEQLIIPGDSQITKSVRFDQNTVSRVLVIPKEKIKEILEQFS